MFEFKFTEEQNMLREMTREFTDNEIKPIAAKIDKEEKIPDDLIIWGWRIWRSWILHCTGRGCSWVYGYCNYDRCTSINWCKCYLPWRK